MKGIRKRIVAVLAIVMVIITMVGCSTEVEIAPLSELKITYVKDPLNVPSLLEKNKHIFKQELAKQGEKIDIKYSEIALEDKQIQALLSNEVEPLDEVGNKLIISGEVDVLYGVGAASVILAASKDENIKILNMYSRSPKAFCLYSKDNNIKSAEDLRGKTIAGPSRTNLHELLLRYLDKAGMTIGDVNYVDMSIDDAKTALDNGSIDAALLSGSSVYKSKQQGYNLITDGQGLTDGMSVIAVRGDFYNIYGQTMVRFAYGQANLVKYMKKNYDLAMDIASKELNLDKAVVEEMYKQYDFSIEVTEEDKESLQNLADFMYEQGMIEKKFDTKTIYVE